MRDMGSKMLLCPLLTAPHALTTPRPNINRNWYPTLEQRIHPHNRPFHRSYRHSNVQQRSRERIVMLTAITES